MHTDTNTPTDSFAVNIRWKQCPALLELLKPENKPETEARRFLRDYITLLASENDGRSRGFRFSTPCDDVAEELKELIPHLCESVSIRG